MSRNAWIIFAVIVVALVGGLIAVSKNNQIEVSDIDPFTIQKPNEQNGQIGDHVLGKADSKVLIYEYADFQCPGCAQTSPVIQKVMDEYGDKVGLVFRNFPILQLHPNARAAAATAEAAGLQGKYWEMHDVLFANQNSWNQLSPKDRTAKFTEFATNLGVKKDQFLEDLTSSRVDKKISFDQAIAKKLKVSGTPTYYVNKEKIEIFVKDDKVVPANTEGATTVTSSADLFIKFALKPALEKAGISDK